MILKDLKCILKTVFLLFGLLSLSNNVLDAQTLEWAFFQEDGTIENCTSETDCESSIQCYTLMYTPNVSGTMTSYTLGFLGLCPPSGDVYLSNLSGSCTMSDNTSYTQLCDDFGMFNLITSGNTGSVEIVAGEVKAIHQVCFTINEGETLNIQEDVITQLSVSVDLETGESIFELLDFSSIDLTINDCDQSLPVDLTSIEVRSMPEEGILIDWIASLDFYTERYEIEWRSNEIKDFTTIKTFFPASSTLSSEIEHQEFLHKNPEEGYNYYRISIFDDNGGHITSKIVSEIWDDEDVTTFNLHPNPTDRNLEITIYEQMSSPGLIIISDVSGKSILKEKLVIERSKSIDVSQLKSGVYVLSIIFDGNISSSRFVKY